MKRKELCVCEHKKAYHDYFVEETLQCGVSLRGNEVKSLREGKASIKEAWVAVQGGNLVVRGMHISKWGTSNDFDVDEKREKQLLAHKREISHLADMVKIQGYTLLPLKVYFDTNNRCKILVGLCKGKHNYDKRECEKEKQAKRDIERAFRSKSVEY